MRRFGLSLIVVVLVVGGPVAAAELTSIALGRGDHVRLTCPVKIRLTWNRSHTAVRVICDTPTASPSPSPTPVVTPVPTPTLPPTPPPPTPEPTPTAPTPTPTPTPPATGCTVTVPSGGSIQAAIDSAAPLAVICLSGTYSASSELRPRSGQTIAGPATVNSVGYHRAFSLDCVTGVTLRDLTIVGSHPQPGTYIPSAQDAHGVGIDGGGNHRLERLSIDKMQGDGVYVRHCGTSPATGVQMTDLTVSRNGRMGIAVVAGRNVTATNTTFRDIAYTPIDCEPDLFDANTIQGCWDLLFDGGTISGTVLGSGGGPVFTIGTPLNVPVTGCTFGAAGNECFIDGVTIRGFTVDVTSPSANHYWSTVGPSNYRARDIEISGNTTADPAYSNLCSKTDGYRLTDNRFAGLSGGYLVQQDCTGVVATGNTG